MHPFMLLIINAVFRAGANETDLVFLRGLLDSPAVTQLIKVSKF